MMSLSVFLPQCAENKDHGSLSLPLSLSLSLSLFLSLVALGIFAVHVLCRWSFFYFTFFSYFSLYFQAWGDGFRAIVPNIEFLSNIEMTLTFRVIPRNCLWFISDYRESEINVAAKCNTSSATMQQFVFARQTKMHYRISLRGISTSNGYDVHDTLTFLFAKSLYRLCLI